MKLTTVPYDQIPQEVRNVVANIPRETFELFWTTPLSSLGNASLCDLWRRGFRPEVLKFVRNANEDYKNPEL